VDVSKLSLDAAVFESNLHWKVTNDRQGWQALVERLRRAGVHFSLILRGVRNGHSYVVTSHGRPVARIVPASQFENVAAGARAALLTRLEKQHVVNVCRWTRAELYGHER
jgi:prevent-host-death family protein